MSLFKKKNSEKKAVAAKPKANRKRTERLSLCLTEEEKRFITDTAKEAGICRTDLIMKAIRAQKPIVITGAAEILLELNRQGNNLNQLSRRVNSYNHVSNTEIQQTTAACREAYREVVHFINTWNIKLKQEEVKNDCKSECCEEQESTMSGD